MPLPPEIISALTEKAAAKERASLLDKEAKRVAEEAKRVAEEAKWVAQRAQLEIGEFENLRADALRKEMEEINTQIKAHGQSQEGLQLYIEESPAKTKYETKHKTFTGLPISQTSSRAAVLTSEGIKTFLISHRINWPARGQIPIFAAEDMTLTDADLKYLLPRDEFPSADALSLRITQLLGN